MRELLPGLLVALPLTGAALTPLFAALFRRSPRWLALALHAAIAAAALALLASVSTEGPIRHSLGGWPEPWGIELWLDGLSALIAALVAAMGLFAAIAQGDRRQGAGGGTPLREGLLRGALMLLLAGLLGITATRDVFNLFVFLEVSALAATTLVASAGGRATVAAFRYLVIGAAAASLYLLGVGFLYALTGALHMDDLAARIPSVEAAAALTVGICLVAVGLSIKAALFPLHGWLPDTYVFAPATAAGFIAAVMAKVTAYALLRLLGETFSGAEAGALVLEVTLWLGVLGILVGGVFAVAQRAVTRMFAWSSVSAMGTILVGVAIGSELAITGALFHIVAHALANGCLFFAAGGVHAEPGTGDLRSWSGLGARAPWVAAALTVAGFSMIGLPPTAGFFSKYLLLSASLDAGGPGGIAAFAALIVSSLLATIYFLRLLEAVWFLPADPAAPNPPRPFSRAIGAPVVGLAVLVLLAGIFSGPLERRVLPEWRPGTAEPAAAAALSTPDRSSTR